MEINSRGSCRGRSRGRTRGSTRGPTRGATRGPTRGSRFAFACSVRRPKKSGNIWSNIRGKIRADNSKRFGELPLCNFAYLGNASLFTKFLFTIFVPLNPPPPNQQSDGFPLEFLLKGPQTELRTLSQNCEQTLQKLRTNRIMNKRSRF